MSSYNYVNDFWDALPREWVGDEFKPIRDGAGRTDAQLDQMERGLGFKLPALFREQYRIQNGGYPKRGFYRDDKGEPEGWNSLYDNGAYALFVDGSHLVSLPNLPEEENHIHRYTFRYFLNGFWNDEEIAANFPTWNVDKLIIISFMWGHDALCLDYGYREGTDYPEPQVVCIETEEFKEMLRVESYERFVAGLVEEEEEEED